MFALGLIKPSHRVRYRFRDGRWRLIDWRDNSWFNAPFYLQ